jgi:hypothetical protein
MNQMGNILSKDPRFVSIGNTDVKSLSGGSHPLQVFRLSKDYKEWAYRHGGRSKKKRIQ